MAWLWQDLKNLWIVKLFLIPATFEIRLAPLVETTMSFYK